jgi:hypothetical protein
MTISGEGENDTPLGNVEADSLTPARISAAVMSSSPIAAPVRRPISR